MNTLKAMNLLYGLGAHAYIDNEFSMPTTRNFIRSYRTKIEYLFAGKRKNVYVESTFAQSGPFFATPVIPSLKNYRILGRWTAPFFKPILFKTRGKPKKSLLMSVVFQIMPWICYMVLSSTAPRNRLGTTGNEFRGLSTSAPKIKKKRNAFLKKSFRKSFSCENNCPNISRIHILFYPFLIRAT